MESIEATETPETPKSKPIALYGAIAVGLAIGAGVGLYVVGPSFVKRANAQAPSVAAAEPAAKETKSEGKEGGKEGKEGAAEKTLHVVDNLVLNPAGSGGTRFLMVNATFDVKDGATVEMMKSRDAEVRDVLLALLGSKTVEQLTEMATRDVLKKEMIAALTPMFPKGTINRVYFPQFVIQ